MLLPYLIYNLSDRGDEFSAAEHGNASACEMRSVQARSRMRISHASLARDRSPLPTLSLSQLKTENDSIYYYRTLVICVTYFYTNTVEELTPEKDRTTVR